MLASRTAAITGIGLVTALGSSTEEFWQALCEGTTGVRTDSSSIGVSARVSGYDATAAGSIHRAKAVQFAVKSAKDAWIAADVTAPRHRIGVIVGTGLGNLDLYDQLDLSNPNTTWQKLPPTTAFASFAHSTACEISRVLDLQGPLSTVSTGCNSGVDAIGLALDWIRAGRADVVIAGGTEAELTPSFVKAMRAARALSVRFQKTPHLASRPFDVARTGNVAGEGAAFVVLEDAEKAFARRKNVFGRILG